MYEELNDATAKRIEPAYHRTWSAIGPDCGFVSDNEEVAELVVDADRLHMFGMDDEAAKLVDNLVKKHGWGNVSKWLASHFNYV